MAVSFSVPSPPPVQTITIDRLLGADFTNTPANVSIYRSPNAINVLRETAGKIRKRTGWRVISTLPKRINGFHILRSTSGDKRLVHAGENIYLWSADDTFALLYSSAGDDISKSVQVGESLWIFDGKKLLCYDGESIKTAESIARTPIIIIARAPTGGGTPYEPINLLSSRRRELFSGTSIDRIYQLTTTDIDDAPVEAKRLNANGVWEVDPNIMVDRAEGTVTFNTVPGVSPILGEDNVSIEYSKTVSGYSDKINKCSIATMYGVGGALDRIFCAGNPDFPNYDWHCELNDPTMWGDTWYSALGQNDSAIMGYAIINNSLAAFKSASEQQANIYLRTGTLMDGEPAFTVVGTYLGAGAISKHSFAILDTEPLYLTASGIHALTPRDNTSERNSELRSHFINGHDGSALLGEDASKAYAAIWNGFYVIAFGENAYLLDGTQSSSEYSVLYSRRQFEGYKWANIPARVLWENDGGLYFGSNAGDICAFYTDTDSAGSYIDGNGQIVVDRWETPFLHGSSLVNKNTFTYAARLLTAYPHTGDEVWAEVKGIWDRIIEQNTQAQYLDFNDIDFNSFTFSTDATPQMLGQKIKIRNVAKARFAFINAKSQPHGIEKIYFELRQGGKYAK